MKWMFYGMILLVVGGCLTGCNKENAEDIYNQGRDIFSGIGVSKNESQAVTLYQKAASKGCIPAMISLGSCYQTGSGITRNATKGAEWYRKAADAGNPTAMNLLAWCYEFGLGMTQISEKARYWQRKAADRGNDFAKKHLIPCYMDNRSPRYETTRAAKKYEIDTPVGEWSRLGNDPKDAARTFLIRAFKCEGTPISEQAVIHFYQEQVFPTDSAWGHTVLHTFCGAIDPADAQSVPFALRTFVIRVYETPHLLWGLQHLYFPLTQQDYYLDRGWALTSR